MIHTLGLIFLCYLAWCALGVVFVFVGCALTKDAPGWAGE